MADRPTAAELVEAVRAWLDTDVRPTLDGRLAFHARVAVNALGIAERDLTADPETNETLRARAAEHLGADSVTDADAAIARALRDHRIDADDPETFALVRDLVRARLQIANPDYIP